MDDNDSDNDSAIAFEHSVPSDPAELWRLTSVREVFGREINHVNWFVTEEAAQRHAAWIANRGGRVLSLTRYKKVRRGRKRPQAG